MSIAQDIIQLACKYTGVNVNYRLTTTWIDNSLMTDSKCDGTIYRKLVENNVTKYYVDTDFLDGKPFNPLRFGMKGDGVFDNSDIWEALLRTTVIQTGVYRKGLHITFPKGSFYFSRSWNLKATHNIEGGGIGLEGEYLTELIFDKNINGIIINRYNTNGNNNSSAVIGGADNTKIKGFKISTKNNFLEFATVIDYNDGRALVSHLGGSTLRIGNGTALKCINDEISSDGNFETKSTGTLTSSIAIGKIIELRSQNNFSVGDVIIGKGTVIFVGKTENIIVVDSGSYTVGETLNNGSVSNQVNYISDYEVGWYKVIQLSNLTGSLERNDVLVPSNAFGTGIRIMARCEIENCSVENFAYHGISVVSLGTSGANANLFKITNTTSSSNYIDGLLTLNGDANAGNIIGFNAVGNGRFAINEKSFLGNHYFGCHNSDCLGGAYYTHQNVNRSGFFNCYSEGLRRIDPYPIPGSRFFPQVVISGGVHGAEIIGGTSGNNEIGYTGYEGGSLNVGQNIRSTSTSGGIFENGLALIGQGNGSPNLILSTKSIAGEQESAIIFSHTEQEKRLSEADLLTLSHSKITSYATGTYQGYIGYSFRNGYGDDRLNITGGGATTQAKIFPVVSGGILSKVLILSNGIGYTSAPTVTGTGVFASATFNPVVANGKLIRVDIVSSPTITDSVFAEKIQFRSDGIKKGLGVNYEVGDYYRHFNKGFFGEMYVGADGTRGRITGGEGAPVFQEFAGSIYIDSNPSILPLWSNTTGGVFTPFQLIVSGNTSSRPTGVVVGFQYFDTTLGKPIWLKAAGVWVDSSGNTI